MELIVCQYGDHRLAKQVTFPRGGPTHDRGMRRDLPFRELQFLLEWVRHLTVHLTLLGISGLALARPLAVSAPLPHPDPDFRLREKVAGVMVTPRTPAMGGLPDGVRPWVARPGAALTVEIT